MAGTLIAVHLQRLNLPKDLKSAYLVLRCTLQIERLASMDADTIATLKTVCTAGSARSGFNGDCNARLEQLVEAGLLVLVNLPKAKSPRSAYQPTAKGEELFRQLSKQGAA
jgi:hypothetical protein